MLNNYSFILQSNLDIFQSNSNTFQIRHEHIYRYRIFEHTLDSVNKIFQHMLHIQIFENILCIQVYIYDIVCLYYQQMLMEGIRYYSQNLMFLKLSNMTRYLRNNFICIECMWCYCKVDNLYHKLYLSIKMEKNIGQSCHKKYIYEGKECIGKSLKKNQIHKKKYINYEV